MKQTGDKLKQNLKLPEIKVTGKRRGLIPSRLVLFILLCP